MYVSCLAAVVVLITSSCAPTTKNVPCTTDTDCDLAADGRCLSAEAGGEGWCAFPDPECAGGYRYGSSGVGDGLSGVCTAQLSPDAGMPPSSCSALPQTCGASRNEDCCASLTVPGGTFHRGFDVASDSDSGTNEYPATVATFRLDKFEVTVGRFRAFLAAGQGTSAMAPTSASGTHPRIPGSGWSAAWNESLPSDTQGLRTLLNCGGYQTWTDTPGANENRPLNCVNWYEAMAFCAWDGGYLPTEAEWTYASAGGDEQRAYPWSNPPSSLDLTPARASHAGQDGCYGDGAPACTGDDILSVGALPDGGGRWGHMELAGNLEEWVLDWYDYNAPSYKLPCVDCAQLEIPSVGHRGVRGGAFTLLTKRLRNTIRNSDSPMYGGETRGFRCARPAA